MDSFWSAQLRARQIEEDTGISLAAQAEMPLDEWSRLTHGKTPVQAALQALGAQQPPAVPQTAPEAPQDQDQGVDLAQMTMEQYAELRGQLGIGRTTQEGIGILSQHASQSWADAARAKAGRHGWVTSNTIESPRIDRVFTEDRIGGRPARDRFGSPSNAFNL